jgi:lysophospholipase L1-like esterase
LPITPRSAKSEGVGVFSRYVALGDSFTEGVGDPYPPSPNGLRGWADRVAVALAQTNPELKYANLAVRGRRMNEILDEQIHTAVMMEPDLVTIYAGMNNLLLLRNDVDAMMARYAEGLKTLQQTGAVVLAFTAADLGTVPLIRRLRGRAAVYNELLRGIADDLGLSLVDFWRYTEFRDARLWTAIASTFRRWGTSDSLPKSLTRWPFPITSAPGRRPYCSRRRRCAIFAQTFDGPRPSRRRTSPSECGWQSGVRAWIRS